MSEEKLESSLQILVADDDPSILKLVKAILENDGFEVVTARDGKEAFKFLQSGETFVAGVFDVVMPYVQGTELVKYMQANDRFREIPVIMITAEQNPRLSQESLQAGATAFLAKPFTGSQLKNTLRTILEKKGIIKPEA